MHKWLDTLLWVKQIMRVDEGWIYGDLCNNIEY